MKYFLITPKLQVATAVAKFMRKRLKEKVSFYGVVTIMSCRSLRPSKYIVFTEIQIVRCFCVAAL